MKKTLIALLCSGFVSQASAATIAAPSTPGFVRTTPEPHTQIIPAPEMFEYEGKHGYVVCAANGNTNPQSEGCAISHKTEGFLNPDRREVLSWDEYVERVTGHKGVHIRAIAVGYNPDSRREVIVYYTRVK